jgi:3-methyl-2-oxobutanoate hydroxymethyltransferase
MSAQGAVRRNSVATLQGFRDAGQRFAVLTAYDRATAELAEAAEIPAILVGDSLAQVALGHESTVRVGMSEMLHHVAAVVRSSRTALVIADMPFLSYVDVATAAINASAFLRDAGAGAVKLEGGAEMAPIVRALVESGVPVIGHIGFTPQSALQLDRARAQGKEPAAAKQLLADALALQAAGAAAIVIELVPAELAGLITQRLTIPTIGIGAGAECSGQVQVVPDLLGILSGPPPRHAVEYATLRDQALTGLTKWRGDVATGAFPTSAQSIPASDELRAALALME